MGMGSPPELKLNAIVVVTKCQWSTLGEHHILQEHSKSVLKVESGIEKVVLYELMLVGIGGHQ